MKEKRGDILKKAGELINGPRNDEHGDFSDNITKWILIMEAMNYPKKYTRREARASFLALKLCRNFEGSDSLLDAAGYIALIREDILKDAPAP